MDIADRVHMLPQELIDQIELHVFTATPDLRRIRSTKAWTRHHWTPFVRFLREPLRSPDTKSLVLCSKATRKHFIDSWHNALVVVDDVEAFFEWFISLSLEQLRRIKEIRVSCSCRACSSHDPERSDFHSQAVRGRLYRRFGPSIISDGSSIREFDKEFGDDIVDKVKFYTEEEVYRGL